MFDLHCIVISYSGKLNELATQAYDENSPPEGVTIATKQPIGAVKQAWSNDSCSTPKVRTHTHTHIRTSYNDYIIILCLLSQIVQPYRRTVGRLAPQGYDIQFCVHQLLHVTHICVNVIHTCCSVPLLDLSGLNEPDDQLQPVQLLQPTRTDFPSHRSLIR